MQRRFPSNSAIWIAVPTHSSKGCDCQMNLARYRLGGASFRANRSGRAIIHTPRVDKTSCLPSPKSTKSSSKVPSRKNPLAFHHYNEDEIVEGKTMKDHLRFAVAYWHTFRGTGSDPFGPGTMLRPWEGAGRYRRERDQSRARGVRVHRKARRAVLLLPRSRRRARKAQRWPRRTRISTPSRRC